MQLSISCVVRRTINSNVVARAPDYTATRTRCYICRTTSETRQSAETLLQAPKDVFVCSVLLTYVQRIRGFTKMRYINLRFSYFYVYLLTYVKRSCINALSGYIILSIPSIYPSSGLAKVGRGAGPSHRRNLRRVINIFGLHFDDD